MPGAVRLPGASSAHGESEFKKLGLGVRCTVFTLSGDQRELGREGSHMSVSPGPAIIALVLVSSQC